MKKHELIAALEPFSDDLEICVEEYRDEIEAHAPCVIYKSEYGQMADGEGILMLIPGKFKPGRYRGPALSEEGGRHEP